MAPRGTPIDHSLIVDGFGEMDGRTIYEAYVTNCGRCGREFTFTPEAQKYVHEVRGVPIKMGRRGAAYCPNCANETAADNKARRELVKRMHIAEESAAACRERPDDFGLLLRHAINRVRLQEIEPSPKAAERIVGDLRRVQRTAPKSKAVEALYWEARLYDILGDDARATDRYATFVASPGQRTKKLVLEARKALKRLSR